MNGAWSRTAPEITIFDDTFVAENVCSGIDVGTAHRQNLHELIVGAQGIALNQALQAEVDRIEVHNHDLREREGAIPAHARGTLSVDAFCALAAVAELPKLIDGAEKRLAAARQAGRIASTATFEPLVLPRIDLGRAEQLLGTRLLDLDAGALARVQAHLANLGRGGEAWVGEGVELADRLAAQGQAGCPFCAQDLAGSPVLGHYRAYFGKAYDRLKSQIATIRREFRAAQSGDIPAAFERAVREDVERHTFWKDFADVPVVAVDTAAIARTWKVAREHVDQLHERKQGAPLDPVAVPPEVHQAIADHNDAVDRMRELSEQLAASNAGLEMVKEQAREANVAALTSDLANLRTVEARHNPALAPFCDAYLQEKAAKTATEGRRRAARTALDQHRQAAFPAYGVAINDFLQRFNAPFRVGPVDPVNTRGGSVATTPCSSTASKYRSQGTTGIQASATPSARVIGTPWRWRFSSQAYRTTRKRLRRSWSSMTP